MRLLLTSTVLAIGLAAASAASAQDYKLPTAPPANPRKVVPDQRLEVANQNMVYAAERLDEAARVDDRKAVGKAIEESRETIGEMRKMFGNLPPDRLQPYEEAFRQTEQVLDRGDPQAGAAAMRDLQHKVLALTSAGG